MLRIIVRGTFVGLLSAAVAAIALTLLATPAGAAGAGGARCHCPCSVSCGGGISCDCTTHAESCAKCSCAAGQIEMKDLGLVAESSARPLLRGSYASWFRFEPDAEIRAALEATMADTGDKETFPVRFLLHSKESIVYAPDESFDAQAFHAWLKRLDRDRPVHLYAAAQNDPATYSIVDGNRKHLNESMVKAYTIDLGDGTWVPVYTSDSTLAWEMLVYLRSAVGEMENAAFLADSHEVQGRLFSMLETMDLLVKASDFDGAARVVDDLLSRGENGWLDPHNPNAESTLCAFRKLRSLLAPGKTSLEAAPGLLPAEHVE